MEISTKFAKEVFQARERENLKQKQVAEAVSISVRWYQRIESGERLPSTVVFLRLVLFLKIDIEKFRDDAGIIIPPGM